MPTTRHDEKLKRVKELEKVLAYTFRKKELLIEAVTHPSFAFENRVPSNERLEFLGDAILSLVIADHLYRLMPDANEGILTQRRADVVQGTSLTIISQRMGLGRFLFLGKGEKKQGGHRTPSNLANVLEAIIGAIYLDSGLRESRAFIHRHFLDKQETVGTHHRARAGRNAAKLGRKILSLFRPD